MASATPTGYTLEHKLIKTKQIKHLRATDIVSSGR